MNHKFENSLFSYIPVLLAAHGRADGTVWGRKRNTGRKNEFFFSFLFFEVSAVIVTGVTFIIFHWAILKSILKNRSVLILKKRFVIVKVYCYCYGNILKDTSHKTNNPSIPKIHWLLKKKKCISKLISKSSMTTWWP